MRVCDGAQVHNAVTVSVTGADHVTLEYDLHSCNSSLAFASSAAHASNLAPPLLSCPSVLSLPCPASVFYSACFSLSHRSELFISRVLTRLFVLRLIRRWQSNPVNDMIADSIVALILSVEANPGSAKGQKSLCGFVVA